MALLSAVIGLICEGTCYAGLVPFHAWTSEYQDGQLLLVMVPTDQQYQVEWDSMMDEPWDQVWEKTDESIEARQLRSLYPVNGLYLNNGSYRLVWEFSAWTYGSPYLSANGRFAVFPGCWSRDYMNLSNPGWRANVADFVVDGVIVASYSIEDLILHPQLKCFFLRQYLSCEKEVFDAEALTYSVATRWGEEIVFDVTTGQIIRHYRPIELIALVLMFFVLLSALAFFLWKLRKQARTLQ